MQKRDRKRYSREFKLEAVRRTQITGKSVAEVVRELELPAQFIMLSAGGSMAKRFFRIRRTI